MNGNALKLESQFTYLGSNMSSTESVVSLRIDRVLTIRDRLSTILKSDLYDKMKQEFFQAVAASVLLYDCTTWTEMKRLKKNLDNYTTMSHTVVNISQKQHLTKQKLYCHLTPIS